MEGVTVGLVNARHPMPVEDYIWNSVPDVLDFDAIDKHVTAWLKEHVGAHVSSYPALDAAIDEDAVVIRGDKSLVVYVTGLTACTASLIKVCAINGITLTLMHYDRDTGTYTPQRIF